ncbi:MAG: [LysW]-aminoadipate/[LysW]-glutamate kinase [Candidatus Baldrarchaeia archaeon]
MIVLKVGGSLLDRDLSNLIDDICELWRRRKVILVHGAGREVDRIAEKMRIRQEFLKSPSGFVTRVTDEETLRLMIMVGAGNINKTLVTSLIQRSIPAIGISGVDGPLLIAKRKKKVKVVKDGRKFFVDAGFTGKVQQVNVSLLKLLLDSGYLPVIAPIALDGEEKVPLNVDADRVAAQVAASIGSSTLILFTDVKGVLIDGELVTEISLDQIDGYIEKVGPGMKRKLFAAKEALLGGVEEVIIASGSRENPVINALAHKECTVVRR